MAPRATHIEQQLYLKHLSSSANGKKKKNNNPAINICDGKKQGVQRQGATRHNNTKTSTDQTDNCCQRSLVRRYAQNAGLCRVEFKKNRKPWNQFKYEVIPPQACSHSLYPPPLER